MTATEIIGDAAPRGRAARGGLGPLLKLALPLAGAQVLQLAMGATDTAILGHVGPQALAVGGLGTAAFFLSYVVMGSVLPAGSVQVAHALGGGRDAEVPAIARATYLVALLLGLLPILPLASLGWLLRAAGIDPALADAAQSYELHLLPAGPAFLMVMANRGLFAALGRPLPSLLIVTLGVVVNAIANYGLVHGAFGLPELGVDGSATATALVIWLQALLLAAWSRFDPRLKGRLFGPVAPGKLRPTAKALLRLGVPMAGSIAVEVALFSLASVPAGRFGPEALAAHQVALMLASILFQLPFGVAQAANVRAGLAAGAGDRLGVRRVARDALMLGLLLTLGSAALLTLAPAMLISLYLDAATAPASAALAASLLVLVALFQLVDGAQTIVSGCLRAIKDTDMPLLLATASYWGVGAPAALWLAFTAGEGVVGLWWGLTIGLTLAAITLAARFVLVTRAAAWRRRRR